MEDSLIVLHLNLSLPVHKCKIRKQMEDISVLNDIDLDEWIYAGYMTTYKSFFKWPEGETIPVRDKEIGSCYTAEDVKKYFEELYPKPPCRQRCACRKTKTCEVEEEDSDEDYLKGFKTTYHDTFTSVPFQDLPKADVQCKIDQPPDEVDASSVSLTKEQENILKRDYLRRQKIKILRKRPAVFEV